MIMELELDCAFHGFNPFEDLEVDTESEEEMDCGELVESESENEQDGIGTNCDSDTNGDASDAHGIEGCPTSRRNRSKILVELCRQTTEELNNTVVTPRERNIDSITDHGHYKTTRVVSEVTGINK
jgi:hypothetical protein